MEDIEISAEEFNGYVDSLEKENDALRAQVEQLQVMFIELRDYHVCNLQTDSPFIGRIGVHENWFKLSQIIDAKPTQCLAEIQAQAIEALNTKELHLLIKTYGSKDCAYRVQKYLESKTNQLRQAAKEPNWDEVNNKLDLARQAKGVE